MVTPSRLRLARERRGLTLTGLARMCGIPAHQLSQYENARSVPDADALHSLASSLSFPVSFLTGEEIEEIPAEAVAFRAHCSTSLRKQRAVRSQAALGVELNAWLSERLTLPAPDVPTHGYPDPEAAAEMVRGRWGLGQAPAPNTVHLLEARGVRVFSLDSEHREVDAFGLWRDGMPYVFLNTAKSGERGRFDAAHELGHLVMHGHDRALNTPEAEREANRFASAFLMPRADILARMPSGAQVDQILEARPIWRVSAMALAHRLHDLGLLTDDQYRSACRRLAELGYRSAEPGGIPRETSQVLPRALAALRGQGLLPARVAAALHIPLEELNTLVFGLALTTHPGGGRRNPSQRTPLRVLPSPTE